MARRIVTNVIRKIHTAIHIIRTEGFGQFLNHLRQKIPWLFLFRKNTPQTSTDPKSWKAAQKHELDFHKRNTFRTSDTFMSSTGDLFRHLGFNSDDYKGKVVIDLGAGSKLRSTFFHESKIVVIEPLADTFINDIEWCDLNDAWKVFSVPAEEMVEELRGTCDFLMSINVLDHCQDLKPILRNIVSYLNDDGLSFLSFDSHDHPEPCHPLTLTHDICETLFHECGLKIVKQSTGLGKNRGYSKNTTALNYWCKAIAPQQINSEAPPSSSFRLVP